MTFCYQGYNEVGAKISGMLEAASLKEARRLLLKQGVLATAVWAVDNSHSKLSSNSKALFYQYLSCLLKAGVALPLALNIMETTPALVKMRLFFAALRSCIDSGMGLSAAVGATCNIKGIEDALLLAGEKSGDLAAVVESLGLFFDERRKLWNKIGTMLLYPVLVLVLALVVLFFVVFVVLPRFYLAMQENRIQLPALSSFLFAYAPMVVIFSVCLFILVPLLGGWFLWREGGREKLGRLLFVLPVIGNGYKYLTCLLFARTFSLLLAGGVSLLESLLLAGRVTGNNWLIGQIEQAGERLRQGASLAMALGSIAPLKEGLGGWLQAGEYTGDLVKVLNNAALYQSECWEQWLGRLVILIEPVVVIFVGGLILLMALAILLPVISLNKAII